MAAFRNPNAKPGPAAGVWRNSLSAMAFFLVLFFSNGWRLSLHGQEPGLSEYQVKAAFLYQFTRFVEWPSASFASPSDPFVVAVLGENPFGAELERAVKGKDVGGHPFVVKEIKTIAEARGSHILFVGKSERRRLSDIIGAVAGLPVLTVGEVDRFLPVGGIINFFIEENKVRFEINDAAAKRAGLKISSKLLYLGRRPERGGVK